MGSSWSKLTSFEKDPKPCHYDAIIVGGGLSGLVAARRLSELEDKRILLIEAGADRRGDPKIDTPGLLFSLWGDPAYDWNFWSESQERLNGRQIPQPRGKVLGGSSAINVAAIVYPTPRNFEAWEKLGVQGWSFDTLAPYYKKFHTFHPASKATNDLLSLDSYVKVDNQGAQGPLPISFPDVYGPFHKAWIAAFRNLGFENGQDPILGRKQGAFMPPNTVDPGTHQRSYAASAYYSPEIEARHNLHLITETAVHKLLFSTTSQTVTATGVQVYGKDGQLSEFTADEVILAAGAIQSPQILENSGIGSAAILEQHGIDVVIDNPGVGENLQDHSFASVSFEVADGQITNDMARDPAVIESLLKQYGETRTGPLSGIPYGLAYVPLVDTGGRMPSEIGQSLIDTHLNLRDPCLSPAQRAQYEELANMMVDQKENTFWYGITPSQMNMEPHGSTDMTQVYSPQRPENFITLMAGLNHPLSRGSVHISSAAVGSPPRIDPGYLSHPLDVEMLARGIQFLERIVDDLPMRQLLKPDNRIPSYAYNLSELETARQVVRDRLWTSYHPSCTCPMMPRERGGVVNDRLLVHGTTNVRIIDASVFPMITQGNIQATVYAVAERACDLIKEDWGVIDPAS